VLSVCAAEWLVFEGISVDENGKQHYLDATVAYKRAVLNCIHYLSKFGYTKEQVCCEGGGAPCLWLLAATVCLLT
jgi:formamidase